MHLHTHVHNIQTKKEADRLVNTLPHCTSMTIKGSGHFVLDDRFNLTKAILKAPFSINQKQDSDSDSNEKKKVVKKYDPIMDWRPATEKVLQKAIENNVQIFRTLTSPVFFSTGQDGIRKKGLGFVPKDNKYDYNKDVNDNKPLLFVANHQLLGLDLGMIISQLLEERGISARGLAHPVVFQGQGGNGFGGPVATDDDDSEESRIERRDRNGLIPDDDEDSKQPGGTFQTFGAVMVTPRNYYRLMQSGQTGLLFPGGVREVFHGKDEAYDLFWPEKVDFVRVAARFNATIVPISAVGAADSANILLDAPEILNLPFGLGERAANNTRNTISARFDSSNSDELFQPPLVVPKPLPARQYFVFGKPFDTTPLDHSDKEGCATLYADVKSELRRGLDDILVAREKDPYQNTPTRLAYERLLGKPAPTFPVDELNQ
jgi:1-acyl-sn-glycerol-3-phosphate acyltransferase